MTGADADHGPRRSFAEALNELIELVQEAKQVLWEEPPGPLRDRIETLRSYLVEQTHAVDEAEQRSGGRSEGFTTPSGRRPENLAAETGGDPAKMLDLLAEHVGAVANDLRRAAKASDGPEQSLFEEVASGLESRLTELRTAS
ncbi:MAG: hypothetical protein JWM85_125 [Acidimicrobiaceae bacterium]|nr:hypothetical protein [Acidimicrobiaceae bacterium]